MIFSGLEKIPNDRICCALAGLPKGKFSQLHQAFAEALVELQREAYERGDRQRQPGGGQVGNLATTEHKLFFLLFYLKNYPTLDVLGYQFGFNASHACRHLQALYPVLERALARLDVLPKRAFPSLEEFRQPLEKHQNLLIDATERPRQRPSCDETQRAHYSGKKNAIP